MNAIAFKLLKIEVNMKARNRKRVPQAREEYIRLELAVTSSNINIKMVKTNWQIEIGKLLKLLGLLRTIGIKQN